MLLKKQEKYLKAEKELKEVEEKYYKELGKSDNLEKLTLDDEIELEEKLRKKYNLFELEENKRIAQNELFEAFFTVAEKSKMITNEISIDELRNAVNIPSTRRKLLEIALSIKEGE